MPARTSFGWSGISGKMKGVVRRAECQYVVIGGGEKERKKGGGDGYKIEGMEKGKRVRLGP
jgi:hypothetical protein